MAYKESDFSIISVDVEEDKQKKRGLFIFGIIGALVSPFLIAYAVMSLMTGHPEASEPARAKKTGGGPNAATATQARKGSSSKATAGMSRQNEAGRRVPSRVESRRGATHRSEEHKAPNGAMAYARVTDTRGANGNARKTSLIDQEALLRRDMGNLSTDLYRSVETHILNGSEISVDILVDSKVLAGLQEDEILQNLDEMESLLRRKYSGVVPTILLKFSNGHRSFKLKTSSLVQDYIHEYVKAQFLEINPRIYRSVDVEIDLKKAKGSWSREISKRIRVKKVDILVNSKAWDAESSSDKVDLLNDTTEFLRGLYPDVTRLVTLKFDDGRMDLPLKSRES